MNVKIIYLNKTKKINSSNLPLVIGYFGCLHKKHVELLTKYKKFNLLTFAPFETKLTHELYDFQTRITYLKAFKPQNIYIYSIQNGNISSKQFIQRYLKTINPSKIIVGKNFYFGSDHGSALLLKKYFSVFIIKHDPKYSTFKIRSLIENKKLEQANKLLYEPFFIQSKWVKGLANGRKIGYPTINLIPNHKIKLVFGSYLSKIKIGNKIYQSVTFIGKSKTFKHEKMNIETHVLNTKIKSMNSYNKITRNNIKVWLLKYLNGIKKFHSINDLKNRIKKTILYAQKIFLKSETIKHNNCL